MRVPPPGEVRAQPRRDEVWGVRVFPSHAPGAAAGGAIGFPKLINTCGYHTLMILTLIM